MGSDNNSYVITLYDYEKLDDENPVYKKEKEKLEKQLGDRSDKDKISDIPERLRKIEEIRWKSLDTIVCLGENSEEPISLLRRTNGGYLMEQYVGLIQDEYGTIVINSRFDSKNDNNTFVNYLIANIIGSDLKLRISDEMEAACDIGFSLDTLLVSMFLHQLNCAAKKGFYRTYRTYKKNDSRLRGTIDIPRHLKENLLLNNGKVAYSYREYTVDNPVNELIFAAYYYVKKISQYGEGASGE